METDLSGPRNGLSRNPIPPPIVTVRSEFPTLNRSRQQQSLTCLVTIEVPEGKWQPDPDDLRNAPPVPPLPQDEMMGNKQARAAPVNTTDPVYEAPEVLEEVTEELKVRVDNWHGLEFARFGKLRLHGTVRVGKDRQSWQELECYLFGEMLICVKEKKGAQPVFLNGDPMRKLARCTLKGSILIRKHLRAVESTPDEPILTLNLSVNELPCFHMFFQSRNQLELWKRAFIDLHMNEMGMRSPQEYEQDNSGTDDDEYRVSKGVRRVSSVPSSYGGGRSAVTAPTEYTASIRGAPDQKAPPSLHVPLDIVVVIPVSSSMQGLKINLLRDALKFLVANLGERDRMGLVTFGSSGGGVPLVGMTTKAWPGWNKTLNSIRPVGQKSLRADVVEGANVAMDLLMQRKSNNPISTILLISDSSTSDADSVDFVVQRAEAAKVAIHSFGLGLTHKPDTMIEMSTRTKASYLYVKDWMMLRECVAGCLGSLQTTSHQNVKLKLRLPEGSPAKFVKISGALQITKRATGKDAEAALGDLRFGDKRDILIQLAIAPDNSSQDQLPQDPWETIVSGLEALGGPLDNDEQRTLSVEELPLIQADLTWNDILREGTLTHLPRPSLLAITMLPAHPRSRHNPRPTTPPIPPHPSIVQRRMELLTSDMLTRALTLVSRGQHERAHHLLHETRTILKGLGKGGLPPVPPMGGLKPSLSGQPLNGGFPSPHTNGNTSPVRATTPTQSLSPSSALNPPSPNQSSHSSNSANHPPPPTGPPPSAFSSPGVDLATMAALDADIEASLEWINHPAVFSRDSRKAVLQAIGVISSQRGYTFRTPSEALWAERIPGIRKVTERGRQWRDDATAFGEVVEE
ncbi:putative von willebrand and ring finger domain protein [Phaeomoniella chlamydospora]|uniref:Putative von willebrand and ring finger domain protein n=1 Tax=Phaeomoniella chlamydospora TaxID=158046 RepID=A0A0G2ECV2_PHACM|nr:putative von willebrand and ring finger domain protein [Phaeomoniella chlamydospora]